MALPPNYLFVNPKDGRLVSQSYLQVPGGTSTVPSISFIDSANSGLSCDASGVVSIISAGSQKVTVGSTTTINSPISLTDALSFPLGTAALPSLYPGTDTNTGIYSPGADQVAISTGGTGRLFVDSSGRVGIGTSTPSVELTISQGATGVGTNGRIALGDVGPGTPSARIDGYRAAASFAGELHLYTSTAGGTVTRAVTIDSSQRVGIGTTSPASALHVNSGSTTSIINEGANYSSFDCHVGGVRRAFFQWSNVDNAVIIDAQPANSTLRLLTADIERARIDSSGRLLVGTSSARSNFWNGSINSAAVQIEGTDYNGASLSLINNNTADGDAGALIIAKSGGSSVGSNTLVANGEALGGVVFQGNDGTEFVPAAFISAAVDGVPGANDMPGRLVFSTTADGASVATERMRIDSTGLVTLAGPGIKFPATQVASADPNTLDDYEEGTFTPTITAGITTPTYGASTRGTYRKVGSFVYFTLRVQLTAGTTSATTLAVGGLPFNIAASIEYRVIFHGSFQVGASGASTTAVGFNAAATMDILNAGSGASISGTTATNTMDLQITGAYPATA